MPSTRRLPQVDGLRMRDVGATDAFLFAAYGYEFPFDGWALLRRLGGPPSPEFACVIMYRAALALHAMHQHSDGERRAQHGEVDLSSVWVTSEGEVRLVGLPDLGAGPGHPFLPAGREGQRLGATAALHGVQQSGGWRRA